MPALTPRRQKHGYTLWLVITLLSTSRSNISKQQRNASFLQICKRDGTICPTSPIFHPCTSVLHHNSCCTCRNTSLYLSSGFEWLYTGVWLFVKCGSKCCSLTYTFLRAIYLNSGPSTCFPTLCYILNQIQFCLWFYFSPWKRYLHPILIFYQFPLNLVQMH